MNHTTLAQVLELGYRVAFSKRYLRTLDRKLFRQPVWAIENERRHYKLYKVTWNIAVKPCLYPY